MNNTELHFTLIVSRQALTPNTPAIFCASPSLDAPAFIKKAQTIDSKTRKKFRNRTFVKARKEVANILYEKKKSGVDFASRKITHSAEGAKATKSSLIDSIALFLHLTLIDAIRQRVWWPNEYARFIVKMPRTIDLQIDHMYDEKLLGKESAKTLKKAHSLAITYYERAKERGKIVLSEEANNELKKAYRATLGIISS